MERFPPAFGCCVRYAPLLFRAGLFRIVVALCGLLLAPTLLRAVEPALELTLPARWYAVPGVPMSLYFDNVVLTETPERLRFEVRCRIGQAESRRWTVTPEDRDVGDHAMEVVVREADGRVRGQGRTVLRVAPRNAGADRAVRLLVVGDSLTHATHYPNELARLLGGSGNPRWTMLGTHRPAAAAPGVAHEGYGGWTWEAFLSRFGPPPPATPGQPPRRGSSPFVYATAGGAGALDLPRYFREECGGVPPDIVTFLLGINDCFRADSENRAAMDATIDRVLDQAEALLAAFRRAAPRTVLAVGLTTPPNAREAGFVASYQGKYHRWGWKRIQHRLVQRMLERLGGREGENIHLVPTQLNLDPWDGYPENNGVHPNVRGYAEIGASFHAWLKAWLDERR